LERLREVEPDIRSPRPAVRTQATMVIPGAATAIGAPTAETTVLGAGAAVAPAVVAPSAALSPSDERGEDATVLTVTADRRKRRGYWIFALVVLLTGLAAGTGWDFRARPGPPRPRPRLVLRRRTRRPRDRARDGDPAARQRPAGTADGGLRGRRRRTPRPQGPGRTSVRHRSRRRPAGPSGLIGHDVRLRRAADA